MGVSFPELYNIYERRLCVGNSLSPNYHLSQLECSSSHLFYNIRLGVIFTCYCWLKRIIMCIYLLCMNKRYVLYVVGMNVLRHMHTHMHTHIYTCIRIYTHACTYTHMHTHIYTCIRIYTHACTYTHIYICIYGIFI